MARYNLCYNLKHFKLVDWKQLALEKYTFRSEIGKLRKIIYFYCVNDIIYEPRKKNHVSENPLATPSGVNSLFPKKSDLRNGITCEVLMEYGWNLYIGN